MAKSLKIAINGKSFSNPAPGGAIRVALNLLQELISISDHETLELYVFTVSRVDFGFISTEEKPRVKLIPLFPFECNNKALGVVWEQSILPLSALYYRCDVLFNWVNSFPVLSFGVPQVNLIHDIGFLNTDWFDRGFSLYLKSLIALAPYNSIFSTVSRFSAKLITDYFNIKNVSVITNGVEKKAKFLPVSSAPEAKQPFYLFIGSLNPRKNLPFLLKAWNQYSEDAKTPPILKIIGATKNVFRESKLPECPYVEYAGFVSDETKWKLLSDCQAVILPSFLEGFGLPIGEAFSIGKPVFASDIEVFREIFGELPIYFDPKNLDSMVDCFQTFIDENGRIIDHGSATERISKADSLSFKDAGVHYFNLARKIALGE